MATEPPATPVPTDVLQALGELIGAHGRLETAYRTAATAPDQPLPVQGQFTAASRWEQTLQILHRATSLVSGLAAGYTSTPNSYDQHAVQPCGGCGRRTAVRIYGQPWHYVCWLDAGCPLTPAAPAPAQPAAVAPETAAPATDTPTRDDRPGTADSAVNGAHSGYRRVINRRVYLDPVEEARDWARAVRKRWPDATGDECAAALDAWHGAMQHGGTPARFVSHPGRTGITIFEWLCAKNGASPLPEPLANDRVRELTGSHDVALRMLAFIVPGQVPREGQAVTELDVTAQYLGAAVSTELGHGQPIEAGPVAPVDQEMTFRRPGYARLATLPDLSALPAHVQAALRMISPDGWLPFPVCRYLQHDHHIALDVAEVIMWEPGTYGRRLDPWCKLLGTGRKSLSTAARAGDHAAELALSVVKPTYSKFLGGMIRSERHNDRSSLRPDWFDMYVSQANINALRAIDKALAANPALRLLGGMKDAFWFLSDDPTGPLRPTGLTYADLPDQPKSFDQPGKWHVNRFGLVTPEIIKAHKSGRVGVLRKAITAADVARKAA